MTPLLLLYFSSHRNADYILNTSLLETNLQYFVLGILESELFMLAVGEQMGLGIGQIASEHGFANVTQTVTQEAQRGQVLRPNPLNLLVRPAGFEPATYGFVVRRSIRAELRAHR